MRLHFSSQATLIVGEHVHFIISPTRRPTLPSLSYRDQILVAPLVPPPSLLPHPPIALKTLLAVLVPVISCLIRRLRRRKVSLGASQPFAIDRG